MFDACIIRVCAARNETISGDVLNAWYAEALYCGFTDEAFKEAAVAVVRSKPFGVTKFSEFLENVKTYTDAEVRELLLKAVRGRLASIDGDLLTDEEKQTEKIRIAEEALERQRGKVWGELEQYRFECIKASEERVREARSWFVQQPESVQIDIRDMALKARPHLSQDWVWEKHWREVVKIAIGEIIEAVDDYRRQA